MTDANPFATATQNHYGAVEVNGLVDGDAYHTQVDYTDTYTLAMLAEAKGHISRVRILTENTFGGRLCDISYIHAQLPGGKVVPVQVGVDNMTPLRELKSKMIEWAQRENVYAKSLGLLDEGNWSILY